MIKYHFTKIIFLSLSLLSIFYFDFLLMLLSLFFGWILFGVVVSITLHRKISHRSFEFKNTFMKYVSYGLLIISGHGTPIGWAAVHRMHHSKCDLPGDPQSPHIVGKIRTFFSWYKLTNPNLRQMIDLLKDKDLIFIDKYCQFLFLIFLTFLYFINPMYVIYFGGVAPTTCLILSGIINTFGHSDYNKIENTFAKNLPFNWLFWGENFHKTHHLSPGSFQRYKGDLSYYLIKFFKK